MKAKLKTLLHMPSVFAAYFLTISFSETAFQICSFGIRALLLYICLDICSVFIVVYLYEKYIFQAAFFTTYLSSPLPNLQWCTAAVILPAVADIFYLVFTKGNLQHEAGISNELIHILLTDIFSLGFRTAISDGMLFWGFAFHFLKKSWSPKSAVILTSMLYALIQIFPTNSFWEWDKLCIQFMAALIMSIALTQVTQKTGSIWSSVFIHAMYNILLGNSHILHIDTQQTYPAVWTYTLDSSRWIFAGVDGTGHLDTALPSIMIFLMITAAASYTGSFRQKQHDKGDFYGK